jgi:magnesium transporter
MAEARDIPQVHDEAGALRSEFVAEVAGALAAGDDKAVRALARDLHAADLADLIEALEPDERVNLINSLGRSFDADALAELDESVRDELMAALSPETIASAIRKLDTDDALYLIEDLDREEQQEILDKVPDADRTALRRGLEFPERTAGRLMQTEFVAVPSFWTVGRAMDDMRSNAENLPERFVEVYVVDEAYHLKGAVPLASLLRNPRDKKIDELVEAEQSVFKVTDDQEDVAYKFDQYNLVSAPVVDEHGRLTGMLMVDDILEVIQEEAGEDILHLAGVGGDEQIGDTVLETMRSRFLWLLVNLATAVLASWVISLFDATIEQMVALAVLMPIVASMGGNAGTQTMTVAVRALATRHLTALNAIRFVMRESALGVLNGLLFALIMGIFAYWWFGSDTLGLVIAAAMVINLLAAWWLI